MPQAKIYNWRLAQARCLSPHPSASLPRPTHPIASRNIAKRPNYSIHEGFSESIQLSKTGHNSLPKWLIQWTPKRKQSSPLRHKRSRSSQHSPLNLNGRHALPRKPLTRVESLGPRSHHGNTGLINDAHRRPELPHLTEQQHSHCGPRKISREEVYGSWWLSCEQGALARSLESKEVN